MDVSDSKPGDHKVVLSCPLTKKPVSSALPISLGGRQRAGSQSPLVPTPSRQGHQERELLQSGGTTGNPGRTSEVTGGVWHRDGEGGSLKNFLADGRLLPD